MRIEYRAFLFFLFLFPLSFHLRAQAIDSLPQDSIREFVQQFPVHTTFSVAVIRDSESVYHGYVHSENGVKATANEQQVFEIGSITKIFTSALLIHAVADKKVKLGKPIKKYLKKIKFKDKAAITLTQLSNHSSGLPRMPENSFLVAQKHPLNPYKAYGEAELVDYLEHWMELASPPGEQYAYSNLGTGLLAYILTKVEKLSFEQLLQKRILEPLEMNQTTTEIDKIRDQLVPGLNPQGKEVPNWEFNALEGAGALFSTTRDLGKWVQQNFSKDPLLAAQRAKTMEVSDQLDMAYGWHIIKNKTTAPLYFHNGGTGGYHSFLVFEPESKTAVIILTNVSAFHTKASEIDRFGLEMIKSMIQN